MKTSHSTPIPVTVVTGFLGAGKTTLVNRWLADAPRGDVAVIVNEHGEVGIDGELLAERVQVLVEITGGCVCCTTQAELVRALDSLATAAAPPKRILIETSGAASPAGVLGVVARGGRGGAFALDGVITVADASRIDALSEHELAFEQLGYADIVVLSRSDACEREAMDAAVEVVVARNGAALLVESARGELVATAGGRLEALLDLRREDFALSRETPATASSSHVYESVSLTLDGDVDGVAERMIVQGVADAVEVTFGKPWGDAPRRSRLVIVGFGLDRASLAASFAACAASANYR